MRRALPSGLGVLCAATMIIAIVGSAFAYFTTAGTGTAAAGVTKLTAPTITAATAATGGTVALTWKAVTAPDGGTVTYYVTRNGGEPDGNCPGAEAPETTTTCTDSGLLPGTYEYKVIARWSTWTVQSAVVSATVTVGPMTKFAIAGSTTTPAAGGSVNLTITAQDAKGGTVTTFTGAHSLVFAGASNAPAGTVPTVANTGGTSISFGAATELTFTSGVSTVASSKNGVLKIYKAGAASITATEGSFTTPTPLALAVSPAATSKFVVTAATSAPTVGAADNLTITAQDTYGNTATAYTGSKSIVFSGPANGPSGTVATVTNASGTEVNIGTATPITFSAGVSTVSSGANGALRLYKSATAAAVKATEGTITGTASITPVAAAVASLTLTTSTTTPTAAASVTATTTAKDTYGNTAVSYTGSKSLTFSGASTSASGTAPTATNSSAVAVSFGTATAVNFTNGVGTSTMKLYKAETANVRLTDGTFTTATVALTVAPTTATKVALVEPAASAGTLSASCLFTCTVTAIGNSGTFSAALAIADAYGNTASNVGASKTAAVTVTGGGTIAGTPLSFPETGLAVTPTRFTFTYPASGTTTNTITAASSGYTSATITATK